MKTKNIAAIAIVIATLSFAASAREVKTDLGLEMQPDEKMTWFQDAKLGMFIHWGLYSGVAKGEWWMENEGVSPEEYRKYAFPESGEKYFAADKYDPKDWMRVAKDAGFKYVCLTAQHHDGYALFASKHPNAFTSEQTHKRDFVKEYVDAAREARLRVGLYKTLINWRYPGYYDVTGTKCGENKFGYTTDPAHKENARLMKEELYCQTKELMSNYGKIDYLFWDGGWLAQKGKDADAAYFWESGKYLDPKNEWPVAAEYTVNDKETGKPLGLMGMVRQLQPDLIANLRSGWCGDFTCEEGPSMVKGKIRDGVVEKCVSLTTRWGYWPDAENKAKLMPLWKLQRMTADCMVRGINLLVNVSPDRHGQIPGAQKALLKEYGTWTYRHAKAIYGTRPGPWQPIDGKVGYTQRYGAIYVWFLDGNDAGDFTAGELKDVRAICAKDLESGEDVEIDKDAGRLVLKNLDATKNGIRVIKVATLPKDASAWEDPTLNSINRLPARAIVVPCESEEKAVSIAKLDKPYTASKYIASLNGEWNFTFYPNYKAVGENANSQLTTHNSQLITVPGCWQLQGDYDPPLYVNDRYPFPIRPPIASGLHPEIPEWPLGNPAKDGAKPDWNIFKFPDAVGVYEREFTVPMGWVKDDRKVTLHFGGVSSAMTVYVNGKEVGYSEDSRLPAEFDITEYCHAPNREANILKVVVRKHCDGSYLEDQDFWRLNGIFRDVYLIAEQKDGLYDFKVETDAATGKVVVRDDGNVVVYETTIPDFKLWTPENPKLYTAAFQVAGDWFAVNFAFRTVTIEDGILKLNGERVLIKGVNRHEISPYGGYYVTREEMEQDVVLIKKFGFNAVRTCHYPDDPYWYDLCDKNGIMLCSEANIECHGMRYAHRDWISNHEEWRKAFLERNLNMVATFRNHPSVIYWSMANESGDGVNFKYVYDAVKAADPTRPVHYEGVMNYRKHQAHPWSDFICPMYPHPWVVEECLKRDTSKPFIMCEYEHSMGNSLGNFLEYWELTEKYPTFQGGFIWDFADQGLMGKDGFLKYGGDFGDKPNGGNGHCNGVFDALRNPHPGAYEVKAVFESLATKNAKSAKVDLDFKPNFMRAWSDNDGGWFAKPDAIVPWRKWQQTGNLPGGCTEELTETPHMDGSRTVDWKVKIADGVYPPPRIGLTFTVPADFTYVKWVGRGPHENYCDRQFGAHFGVWEMDVDELNASHYIRPGECGHRGDVSRLELSNGKETIVIETLGAPFGFNVWPWTQDDLHAANHEEELVKRDFLTVNLNAAMMGVGGDDSWGARPMEKYMPRPGDYRLTFTVRHQR